MLKIKGVVRRVSSFIASGNTVFVVEITTDANDVHGVPALEHCVISIHRNTVQDSESQAELALLAQGDVVTMEMKGYLKPGFPRNHLSCEHLQALNVVRRN